MNLRPYQEDFVAGVAKGFHAGFRRLLGALPTGGGKTICFAKVAQRFWEKRNEKTLILAHREELIEQAADKVFTATGITPSIEKAGQHADPDSKVVVGSIQTLQSSRLAGWAPNHFGLLVCDEAHHAISDQWQKTLSYFDARVLGVTATPDRGDKKRLSVYFEDMAYEIGLLDLIKAGYLSKILIKSMPLKIDLSRVPITGGEFDAIGLDSAITPYLAEIARIIAGQFSERKRIVAFLPLVATSKLFVEKCREVGINARHIDGASPDRKEILADYEAGKIHLLSNAMLLTEGWDSPGVDLLLPLRPLRSRSLYAQIVGRGTRLYEGKENLMLLDPLWMHMKHDLAKPASLVAVTKQEEESITKILLAGGERDLGEATMDAAIEREAALIREIAKNAHRKAMFLPIESVGALLKDAKIQHYAPIFDWERIPATEKQSAVLSRFGLKAETKGEASILMGRLFDRSRANLATIQQLKWLVRMKHPSPETATKAEAKAFLDEKWKRSLT